MNCQSGANAIYYAARHGHVETLKFLHEKKCPLDVQDKVKQVPLFLSLHASHIQTYANTLMYTNTHIHTCTDKLSAGQAENNVDGTKNLAGNISTGGISLSLASAGVLSVMLMCV